MPFGADPEEPYATLRPILAVVIPEATLFERFDPAVVKLPPAEAAIAAALRYNVLAVSRSVSLPWRTASRFRMLETMDDFRRLYPTEERAAQAWNTWVLEPDIADANADAVATTLSKHLSVSPEIARDSEELRRQGTVLLMAAFETFIRDINVIWNGKRQGFKDALCEILSDHADVEAALKALDLWKLYQDRHAIAHRCGIVDEKYIQLTGSSMRVGDRLVVGTDEMHHNVFRVVNAAQAMLEAPYVDVVDKPPPQPPESVSD